MEGYRPKYLVNKLLSNKLSMEELDELLANIGEKEMTMEYSVILEEYFNNILDEFGKKSFHNN